MPDQTTQAVELAGRLEHEGEVLPAIGAASSGRLCIEAAALLRTQAEEIERLARERDALKLQAECWAIEARGHKTSLHEAYQAVTGGKGEPGNWNGSRPIIAEIERLRGALSACQSEAAANLSLSTLTENDWGDPATIWKANKAALDIRLKAAREDGRRAALSSIGTTKQRTAAMNAFKFFAPGVPGGMDASDSIVEAWRRAALQPTKASGRETGGEV